MKKLYTLLLALTLTGITNAQTNVGITGNVDGVYINEFHYDNQGTDVNEFVEIAGPAGTDLSTYTITLYNGSNNTSYSTTTLSGMIDNEGAGVGAVVFFIPNIQNGAPDAIALSKSGSTSVQYLSYEGAMSAAAVDGPALGLNAVNIGVSEAPTATVGDLLGYSLEYDEGSSSWVIITNDTPGDFGQGPVLSSTSFNAIEGLTMYPNPVSGGTLNFTSTANAAMSVQIFDLLGKEVLKSNVVNNTVNVAKLTAGVYVVKITEEGKTATRKLVIK